jgi:hypothetical protein
MGVGTARNSHGADQSTSNESTTDTDNGGSDSTDITLG